MNFDRFDLNLLRVFRAVHRERSVLRAAKELNLSHSAISHALRRLRDAIGDELFVRTGTGMVPTQRAQSIAPAFEQALSLVQSVTGDPGFDPDAASVTFTLAATDGITDVLVTRLSDRFCDCASQVDLCVRPSTRLDLAEQLDVGRIDVAIGVYASIPDRFKAHDLWKQEDVMLVRRKHPLDGEVVTLASLASFPLVTISVGGEEEGAVNGFIEERGLARQSEMFDSRALMAAMRQAGLTPRVRVAMSHTLALPGLLRKTDMVSILPRPWAEQLASVHALSIAELPYFSEPATLKAVWRADRTNNPAISWLISHLVELSEDISSSWRA